jgi:biopolymer transport protein ExbD
LRTRYFPKARLGHGLLSIAPWLDVILLFLFFVYLNSRWVLQPGVVIELPDGPFREGSHFGMVAVAMSIETSDGRAAKRIVFFDDERFMLQQPEQKEALRRAFTARVEQHPDTALVIQADKHLPHGTVMEIVNMALDAGVGKVNIGVRPY